ncbi:hypothetical protein [Brevundimonas aurifodinae]|uniref:Chromosome partitioning protein ParB n=1 Tax=Brevundimonas aurifodinae TaxID=1508312 RepID=A0ABV1NND0_9CAUL
MSGTGPRRGFAARPTQPDAWVSAADRPVITPAYTARLTIDVTPALRARIKISAFQRGQTVADAIRALLEREFPEDGGGTP